MLSRTAEAPLKSDPRVKELGMATTRSPADTADFTPRAESSTTMQCAAGTSRSRIAVRYGSGCGFALT